MAVSGIAVACVGAGSLFLYAGLKGKSITASFQNILTGKTPTTAPSANPISDVVPVTTNSNYNYTGSPTNLGSVNSLMTLWTSNGGDPNTAYVAANVAMAESSGNAKATSSNPGGPGCTNVGLWQLATPCGVGGGYSIAQLQDPNFNAKLTIMATSNGTNWSQWADSVVVNGQYIGPTEPTSSKKG